MKKKEEITRYSIACRGTELPSIFFQDPDLSSTFLPGDRKRKGCSIRAGENCPCSFCSIIRSNFHYKANFFF